MSTDSFELVPIFPEREDGRPEFLVVFSGELATGIGAKMLSTCVIEGSKDCGAAGSRFELRRAQADGDPDVVRAAYPFICRMDDREVPPNGKEDVRLLQCPKPDCLAGARINGECVTRQSPVERTADKLRTIIDLYLGSVQ